MPSLGDALEYIGGSIDKPGRAVRGLLTGKLREGMAAIPFSDTMGITNPEDRTSGRDLTDKAGITQRGDKGWGSWGMGIGAELATDPLNYIPMHSVFKGLKGLLPGAKAAGPLAESAKYLKYAPEGIPQELHNAADAMGPMYPGGVGKFDRILSERFGSPPVPDSSGFSQIEDWRELRLRSLGLGPDAERLAGELPEGSKYMNLGAEAMAFRKPDGGVVRISDLLPEHSVRPDIPEMLQPYRAAQIGKYHVEHLPYVNNTMPDHSLVSERLSRSLGRQGFEPWDVRPGNVSRTAEGNILVHDPGAIGHELPGRPTYPEPNEAMAAQLLKLGSPEAVRQSLAKGLAAGTAGQGVTLKSLFPEAKLHDRLAKMMGESAKSLGLKYDNIPGDVSRGQTTPFGLQHDIRIPGTIHTPESLGLARNDPEWVNNRTFYHGTASDLTGALLDPRKTSIRGLHGQGIYQSDEAGLLGNRVTKGYANARTEDAMPEYMRGQDAYVTPRIAKISERIARDKRAEYESRRIPAEIEARLQGLGELKRATKSYPALQRVVDVLEKGGDFDSVANKMLYETGYSDLAESDVLSKWLGKVNQRVYKQVGQSPVIKMGDQARLLHKLKVRYAATTPTPNPRIYQSQSDFGKILDLDSPPSKRLLDSVFDASGAGMGSSAMSALRDRDAAGQLTSGTLLGHLRDADMGMTYNKGGTVDSAGSLTNDVLRKELGYDALTHSGGINSGGGHQVVIGLDPNDVHGIGRATPYKIWEKMNEGSRSLGGKLDVDGAGRVAGVSAAGGHGDGGGLASTLRGIREGIPVVKDAGGPRERIIGGGMSAADNAQLLEMGRDIRQTYPDALGQSISSMGDFAGIEPLRGAALVHHPSAGREETFHGMIQHAAGTGDMSGLPLAARPVAKAYQIADRLEGRPGGRASAGLAQVLDEMVSKYASGRGVAQKAGNLADFLYNPEMHAAYGPQFGQFGVVPRMFYHGMPFVPPAAAGMAARATVPARPYETD